MYISKVKGGKC